MTIKVSKLGLGGRSSINYSFHLPDSYPQSIAAKKIASRFQFRLTI
jgi:hypothetical protein